MTTLASGRLGGQYMLTCITDDVYRVSGHLHGTKHTIGSGSYADMTRLLDYCATHDGQTQEAMNALFYDGDPMLMIQLHETARDDPDTRPRRRVALVLFVATDVLESENAITLVTERVASAMQLAGVTVMELSAHYETDITPQGMREQLQTIDEELGKVREFGSPEIFMREAAEPAVQTGAPPLVSDPSDRDSVQQSPMTRPNK